MFVDEPGTGIVLSGLFRYNLFTTAFFLGRQARLLAEFADRAGVREGEDALDIGCGPGRLVRVLGQRVGERGSVTGVDPSAEAIEHNSRRDPSHRYLRSTAQQLMLPDAAFDVVTCTFVMHHIPERHREEALAEMWRVLRPGGRLLLADAHPSDRVQAVFALSDRVRRKEGRTFDATDVRRYSDTLDEIGFGGTAFAVTGYNTACLLAVKPER